MKKMEGDRMIAKWTKHHGIVIEYITEPGNKRGHRPDFLVERVNGTKELHEMKVGNSLIAPTLSEGMTGPAFGANSAG